MNDETLTLLDLAATQLHKTRRLELWMEENELERTESFDAWVDKRLAEFSRLYKLWRLEQEPVEIPEF